MCVICQDPLLNPDPEEEVQEGHESLESEPAQQQQQKEMVTTKCGHLFHSACLNQWFNVKHKLPRYGKICILNNFDTPVAICTVFISF